MPGPSTTTGTSTIKFRAVWRSCWVCRSGSPRLKSMGQLAARWCSKAARSTPTAQGILLTTEECLLSEVQQRNPGVSREQLEQVFADYLGIDQVIWLDRGIAGDDTHGHVDDITRFVAPATIVTAVEPNTQRRQPRAAGRESCAPEGRAHARRQAVHHRRTAAAASGRLSRPAAAGQLCKLLYRQRAGAGADLSRSQRPHCANILAEVFPDREVIGIHSVDLVWGLGTLHCMTQQQPAAAPAAR